MVNMTVLILGGAGYIGSNATDIFLNRGYDVAIIDNLSTGHIESVSKKARFYKGDIRDESFLRDVFEKEPNIEGIIHFCAHSIVAESVKKPLMYFDNNVGGAITLLKVMEEFDVNHIVFSSTAATFGSPEDAQISEITPQNPINPYGESKLMMETIMKWQSQASNMTYVALRYFNVAGAKSDGTIGEAHTCETHLIPLILQVAQEKRESIAIFGTDYPTPDGTCVRDYIDVTDLIDAHIRALEYLKSGNKSNQFNLGTANGYSNLEVLETARKVTGHSIPAVLGERRPGDPAKLIANSQKAKDVLGWQPKSSLEDIIESAWKWHSSHPNGY